MQIFYTVRFGDTLYNIALRFNIPLISLINSNNLTAPYTIYVSQQLSMPPGVNTYVVKPGESIFSISQSYGIPASLIIEANGISSPYIIIPGQVLVIPQGVPFYVVRPGDTLYKIAARYNVTLNGQPRPDLIINANPGLTSSIVPGMAIAIPYPPPGGTGKLAVILNDDISSYLGLYEPSTGRLSTMPVAEASETSRIFWSPDQTKVAYIGSSGIISIIDTAVMRTSNIDEIDVPGFIDWAPDSRRISYSKGENIIIYDVISHTFKTINRPETLYVQWFPSGTELLYEAKDKANVSQLYRNNTDGTREIQITNNINGLLNNVRLSPNGRFALYTTPGVSISEIYIVELATGKLYKIPGGPEAKNYYPTWSPDSNKIAYSSTQFINGKYYSLIRFSGLRGEGDSTVAISSCYSTPVTWSPDSRKIAYLSGCRDEYRPVEVWSIDITRLVPVNLLSGYSFYSLDWSPSR
jgi:TolB protein